MTANTDTEDRLRAQVRTALRTAHISQASVARQLGLSTKHLCQMLTGRATLTLDWAEKVLDVCGMRIVIGIELVDRDAT